MNIGDVVTYVGETFFENFSPPPKPQRFLLT
jgi:hypothetical protein